MAAVDQGFRKAYRLRKTDDFSSVFAFRRVLRGDLLELLYRPGSGSSARLGIVVAKRLVRSAAARNRIKRVVRESFRQERQALPATDIVVRVRARLARVERAQLARELRGLLARLPPR